MEHEEEETATRHKGTAGQPTGRPAVVEAGVTVAPVVARAGGGLGAAHGGARIWRR